jgi:hypothetical protein
MRRTDVPHSDERSAQAQLSAGPQAVTTSSSVNLRSSSRRRRAVATLAGLSLAWPAVAVVGLRPEPAGAVEQINPYPWHGWADVSNGRLTPSTPEAVTYAAKQYVFIRGLDDHVYYNVSSDGARWAGWTEVPGAGRTTDTPAVVVWKGNLHIFVRGADGYVWGNAFTGASWNGWAAVPGSATPSAPATVVYRNVLYLLRRSTENRILFNSYTANWNGWLEVPGNGATLDAPAAGIRDDTFHIFVRGTDNRVWGNAFRGYWNGWAPVPGGYTPSAPAVLDGYFDALIAIRGYDDRVYINDWSASSDWAGWQALPGVSTTHAPSLSAGLHRNEIYVSDAQGRVMRNSTPKRYAL